MKRPRDLSADELVRRLKPFGYRVTRQLGSHLRLTTEQGGQHHLTIPAHANLTIGKVNAVIWELVRHFGLERRELVARLFG
ncbi:MAG: type II toxin-antitoxin system HicA family toxin [Myxococcota bacterium]|nr:type II toxin-antitoxin system HicA family toxin [Myxococcota bacterium]